MHYSPSIKETYTLQYIRGKSGHFSTGKGDMISNQDLIYTISCKHCLEVNLKFCLAAVGLLGFQRISPLSEENLILESQKYQQLFSADFHDLAWVRDHWIPWWSARSRFSTSGLSMWWILMWSSFSCPLSMLIVCLANMLEQVVGHFSFCQANLVCVAAVGKAESCA